MIKIIIIIIIIIIIMNVILLNYCLIYVGFMSCF